MCVPDAKEDVTSILKGRLVSIARPFYYELCQYKTKYQRVRSKRGRPRIYPKTILIKRRAAALAGCLGVAAAGLGLWAALAGAPAIASQQALPADDGAVVAAASSGRDASHASESRLAQRASAALSSLSDASGDLSVETASDASVRVEGSSVVVELAPQADAATTVNATARQARALAGELSGRSGASDVTVVARERDGGEADVAVSYAAASPAASSVRDARSSSSADGEVRAASARADTAEEVTTAQALSQAQGYAISEATYAELGEEPGFERSGGQLSAALFSDDTGYHMLFADGFTTKDPDKAVYHSIKVGYGYSVVPDTPDFRESEEADSGSSSGSGQGGQVTAPTEPGDGGQAGTTDPDPSPEPEVPGGQGGAQGPTEPSRPDQGQGGGSQGKTWVVDVPAWDEPVYEERWVEDSPAWDEPVYEDTWVVDVPAQAEQGHTESVLVDTIHHDEVGHYEDVEVGSKCVFADGFETTDPDEAVYHSIEVGYGYSVVPIYESQWVVDQEAWDEPIYEDTWVVDVPAQAEQGHTERVQVDTIHHEATGHTERVQVDTVRHAEVGHWE